MALARLFPVVDWDAGTHLCRVCDEPIMQADAEPYPNPPGWRHPGCTDETVVETVEIVGDRL
jgi:hypothetical protein